LHERALLLRYTYIACLVNAHRRYSVCITAVFFSEVTHPSCTPINKQFFYTILHNTVNNTSGYQFRATSRPSSTKTTINIPYINPVNRCHSLFTRITNLVKNGAKLDEETIVYLKKEF
jgi:hypothetical protein